MTTLNPIRGTQIHTEMHRETHTQGGRHREQESEGSPAEKPKMRSSRSTERCQKGGNHRKSHRMPPNESGTQEGMEALSSPQKPSEGATGAGNRQIASQGGAYAQ